MDDGISDVDLAELIGPGVTEIKAPVERRHPFKEYTYEELTNAPKKVYLCGDDDHPVLLTDALWQTMGLLKSAKTYFCMELGFCIAFGLEFHGLKTKEGNVAYIIAEGGSTFGRDQTGLPQFSLGGPSRLAAYGTNEFLTNQYFYSRLGYLHRIAEMPSFLGKGVYFAGHYELAKPYAVPNVSGLPNDVAAGIALETLVGPVFAGASAGSSGRRRWFFQLGRIF